ncbi:MAG: pyruvate ferredoxin oxidoreductase [Firmicutes bacterium]|nr:pyruvate ferredoxin oxidoreductase [Bacillota bacterium]
MSRRVAITGNEAIAEAMRQINPDVVAAYPITPATEIVQMFANSVSDGKVDTEFVTVESEHSAMSAAIGASAAGARAMTATSSQGLALMWEMLYIAAGLKLPIVAPIVNRALSAPINIHCDHSDTMGARDSGWIQIYSEDAQEAYDNLIQAIRIAEHPDVLLPAMVTMDGFIVSHGMSNAEFLDDDVVRGFIKEYEPKHYLLDVENPITVGALDFSDWYFEHRRQVADAHTRVKDVVLQVAEEFKGISGREYKLFDGYKLDDAEYAIVIVNSAAGTAKTVVDELRAKGLKAGLLKIRLFRPFPQEEIVEALSGKKAIAVLDRADTLSLMGGPLYIDLRAAMYDSPGPRVKMVNYIYGLGGRDINMEQIAGVYNDLVEIVKTGEIKRSVTYLGVRE